MGLNIAIGDELIGITKRQEPFRKAGESRVDCQAGGGDKMGEQVFRVFVAHCKADCARPDAGLLQFFGIQLRMSGECRATHNGVRLAKADHVGEGWSQAVEEPLEGVARDGSPCRS